MRTLLSGILALALVGAASPARAQEGGGRPFGLGLMIGAPTGLSGKLYMDSPVALAFGLGAVEQWGDDGLHLHVDVLWHPVILARNADFTLPFYLGVGGRLLHHDWHYDPGPYDDDDTHLGVRAPFGLLMDFNKVPLDLFFELALVVDFLHVDHDYEDFHDHDIVDLYGALGVRYYF